MDSDVTTQHSSEIPVALRPEARDALRAQLLTARFYSPWVHLGVTSSVGLGAIALAATQLHELKLWQVLFGVGLWVFANATEWRIHKSLLHHRTPPLAFLYQRHTPQHHVIYLTDDMAIRSTREFKLVLLPAYAIVAAFVGLLPISAALWFGWPVHPFAEVDQHNLAAVFTLVTMGFLLTYEWLHLAYHLPEANPISRLALIRRLKRHHALHHHPTRMNGWNFNVSIPLWDHVRGTVWRAPSDTTAPERETATATSR